MADQLSKFLDGIYHTYNFQLHGNILCFRKTAQKPKYTQKARMDWLQLPEYRDWLDVVQTNKTTQLKCKYCLCKIGAKKSSLNDHMRTKKHKDAMSVSNIVCPIPFKRVRVNVSVSKAEARLALLVAKHTAINTIDHITQSIKVAFDDSSVAQSISLGRTKCAAIIKNVWYPHFKKDLCDDIGDGMFSLLVDESTDISTIKQLGIVIKYFSTCNKSVVGSFLKLQGIDSGNAETIANSIKTVLFEFGLNIQKCVGIGTDNAAVMVGQHNGVFAILKREIKHLMLVPCVCHSLQLAISEVCREFMPTELEFLISETYNWFARSSGRQQNYRQLYNVINDGHDPLRIVQACQTRWLSIETAVTRILDQWDELKTHFQLARMTEKCFIAERLFEIYSDDLLKSYIIFVKPHLQAVQRVNKNFQGSSSTDISKLFNDLCMLVEETANVITVKRSDFDPFKSTVEDYKTPNPYLGYGFETHIANLLIDKSSLNKVVQSDVDLVRAQCIAFITNLIYSLRKRLPTNIKILRQINIIAVEKALAVIKPSISPIMQEFGYEQSFITSAEMQWKNLPLVEWTMKDSTSSFWAEVYYFKDAGGNNPFKELASFALHLLALPFSNAEVERVFSQLNLVKNKVRNRMEGNMINAIIMIRSCLSTLKKCCSTITITDEIVKEIGTLSIYDRTNKIEDEDVDTTSIVDLNLFN